MNTTYTCHVCAREIDQDSLNKSIILFKQLTDVAIQELLKMEFWWERLNRFGTVNEILMERTGGIVCASCMQKWMWALDALVERMTRRAQRATRA